MQRSSSVRAARAAAIRRYAGEFSRRRAAAGKPPAPKAMRWAAALMIDQGTTVIDVVYADYRKDEYLSRVQPDLRSDADTGRAADTRPSLEAPEHELAANDEEGSERDRSPLRDAGEEEAAVQDKEVDPQRGFRGNIVARLVHTTLTRVEAGDLERAVGIRSAILRGQLDFAHEYVQAMPVEATGILDDYEVIVAECAERASEQASSLASRRGAAREARKNRQQRTRRTA